MRAFSEDPMSKRAQGLYPPTAKARRRSHRGSAALPSPLAQEHSQVLQYRSLDLA